MTIYRSDPVTSSNYACGRAFPTAEEALRHARKAADACSIGYAVYALENGRPKRLATFTPAVGRAETMTLIRPQQKG
jgi:hypothetical protein